MAQSPSLVKNDELMMKKEKYLEQSCVILPRNGFKTLKRVAKLAEQDLSTLFECDTRVNLSIIPMHKIKAREERARKKIAPGDITNVEELSQSNPTQEPEFY